MTHELDFRFMQRRTDGTPGTKRESYFVDFMIGGSSLLHRLAMAHGSHSDFAGCFERGLTDVNAERLRELLCSAPAPLTSGRRLLYVCPECGDLKCGAYAVRIEDAGSTFKWFDFAHENGYEDPEDLPTIGPFMFARAQYEEVLSRASAA